MTLILSAFYKNGICICADKRYRITKDGKTRFEDNHSKVYQFTNRQILIFNHGENRFSGKYWNEYCEEYEESGSWERKNIDEIADDFKNYITPATKLSNGNPTYFCICGKTENDQNYKIFEFSWDGNEEYWTEGIICSGDGKDYIESFIRRNSKYNNNLFWNKLDKGGCKGELKKIFEMAVKNKKISKSELFSDECNLYDI